MTTPESQQNLKLLSQFKLLNELSIKLQGLLTSTHLHQEILNLLQNELGNLSIQYWSLPSSQGVARLEARIAPEKTSDTKDSTIELGQALSPKDSVLAYVFESKKSLLLDVIPNEVRASSPIVSRATQSLLAIPVLKDSTLLGILIIENLSPDGFDESDVMFFESIASQIQIAISNQKILFESQNFNKKLQTSVEEKSLELKRANDRILEQQKNLQKENKALKTLVEQDARTQEMIGHSPAIQQVLAMVEKIAPTTATVLILGESGTGKELIAKKIHTQSARANAPYVTVNCAALQESLLESELFGHEKGSFTGAVQQKIGLCEVADGGTLFLDEIGEMSPAIQTKLLRFLQEGEFYRIGGKKPIQVNVRILSATNRDLTEEVRAGRFREDLFYRLNTISLKMPPLRARREDIPLLCEHFLKSSRFGGTTHVKKIDPRVIEVFQNYNWPGNIRELQNTMERLKILSEGSEIKLDDVPFTIRMPKSQAHATEMTVGMPLEEVEKSHILRTLAFNQGNKTKTAHTLGITIKTLYNKLHRYGVLVSDEQNLEPKNQGA
jgi:transcriptional regulator with GAF, ATPase, and Fis domain